MRDIGFGSILSIKLHSVPCAFGYWLVKNFDAETDILNIGDQKIKITTALIKEVFQIPLGKLQVYEKNKPKVQDPVVKFWRGQFNKKNSKNAICFTIDHNIRKHN